MFQKLSQYAANRLCRWPLLFAGALMAFLAAPALEGLRAEGTDDRIEGQTSQEKPTPEQVVILRNGGVLRGQVQRVDGRYIVRVTGGQVQLPADEVEMVADSLTEAYERQRRQLVRGDPDEHVRLARWCLRQGLADLARQELTAALDWDPDHTTARTMLRRLGGRQGATVQNRDSGLVEDSTSVVTTSSQPSAPAPSAFSPQRAHAGGRRIPTKQSETPSPLLSEEIMGDFTSRVQPLLVNSCTTTGCHSARADGGFRLVRTNPGRYFSQQLTQRNLQAVLAWIDLQQPEQSGLLISATRAHGVSPRLSFPGLTEVEYQTLVEWVFSLARYERESRTAQTARESGSAEASLAAGQMGSPTPPVSPTPPSVAGRSSSLVEPVGADGAQESAVIAASSNMESSQQTSTESISPTGSDPAAEVSTASGPLEAQPPDATPSPPTPASSLEGLKAASSSIAESESGLKGFFPRMFRGLKRLLSLK